MKKKLSFIFIFMFMLKAFLFSGTATEIIIKRDEVQKRASKFLIIDKWEPKITSVSIGGEDYTSF